MPYAFNATTVDPDIALRWLDEGYEYMSQGTKECIIDALINHGFALGHPNVFVGLELVYIGGGGIPPEADTLREQIMWLNQRDWQKHSMPAEHDVPYVELPHEKLLEIAKRPSFDSGFQRDFFTSDEVEWDVTRAFVDARSDLSDWEWSRVSRRARYIDVTKPGAVEDVRRWIATKRISETALWSMGIYDHYTEALEHISVDTIMGHLKYGDAIYYEDAWLAATGNVGERICEVKRTGDVRTLGYAIGMSGQPMSLAKLEAILSGSDHQPIRFDGDWGNLPGETATEFAVGFHRTAYGSANEDTLLATLQLLAKHAILLGDTARIYDLISNRPEAVGSEKIQRWRDN